MPLSINTISLFLEWTRNSLLGYSVNLFNLDVNQSLFFKFAISKALYYIKGMFLNLTTKYNDFNFDCKVAANFVDDEDEADDGYDEELERRRKEFQKRERLEKAGKLPQVIKNNVNP